MSVTNAAAAAAATAPFPTLIQVCALIETEEV